MGRRDVLLLAAIALFGACAGLLGAWIRDRQAGPPLPPGLVIVEPGQPLPPLQLATLDGGPVRQLAGPGRVRLLNYWASWCGPCRDEMPALQEYANSQGANGVEVIGIALDSPDAARAFAESVGVRFVLLVEPPSPGDSSVVLGNRRGVLPFTALVDADGRLLKTHYGSFDDSAEIAAWVARR
jgi:thiol-disulfide isomerase/thioredoxin